MDRLLAWLEGGELRLDDTPDQAVQAALSETTKPFLMSWIKSINLGFKPRYGKNTRAAAWLLLYFISTKLVWTLYTAS